MTLDAVTDALRAAQKRGALPTSLGTAELRELGSELLARSVFTARGTNVIFTNKLKTLIDSLAAGDLGQGQVITAIAETLDALGYDAEQGGFPGEELEPALKGTLQDLRSFRRMKLIVETQRSLMAGAGQKMRGTSPEALTNFPAWELVRFIPVDAPRNWDGDEPSKKDPRSRWVIAGGKLTQGRMIALKGDPIWGELGSFENFSDALGVDHPPFAFNSGMRWQQVSNTEVRELGITGPNGETPEEFLATRPRTLTGSQPLPTPKLSLKGVDPDLIARFKKLTEADGSAEGFDFEASARRTAAWQEQELAKKGDAA